MQHKKTVYFYFLFAVDLHAINNTEFENRIILP